MNERYGTMTSWIEYGIFSNFRSSSLYDLAEVYDCKVVALSVINKGLTNQVHFKIEGTESHLNRFNEALRSLGN